MHVCIELPESVAYLDVVQVSDLEVMYLDPMKSRPKLARIPTQSVILWRCTLLLAAFGWIAPVVAQASCGDYLLVGGDFRIVPHGLMADGQISNSPLGTNRVPVVPARPCTGPNCGKLPVQQAVPEILPRGVRFEQAGAIHSDLPMPPADGDFFFPRDSTAAISTWHREIFHPPRVS